jgi:hypothetical protein
VTRVLAVATVLLALMVLAPAVALAREETRRVCARAATVRDTPRGFAIARLYRRDRVTVVRRSGVRGWVPIRTRSGLPGWILTRSLCRG